MATPKTRKKHAPKREADGKWKKGECPNPSGRPKKGYSITEMMREMLDSNPDIKLQIGAKIIAKALRGDIAALKLLWQYMDGMPKQTVENTGGIAALIQAQEATTPEDAGDS